MVSKETCGISKDGREQTEDKTRRLAVFKLCTMKLLSSNLTFPSTVVVGLDVDWCCGTTAEIRSQSTMKIRVSRCLWPSLGRDPCQLGTIKEGYGRVMEALELDTGTGENGEEIEREEEKGLPPPPADEVESLSICGTGRVHEGDKLSGTVNGNGNMVAIGAMPVYLGDFMGLLVGSYKFADVLFSVSANDDERPVEIPAHRYREHN